MLGIAGAVYLVLQLIKSARFGKILVGVRENETRMEALGYAPSFYKTAAFALSAGLAGLAGALYATHAGFVAPSLGGVLFSTEVVVWVAVAGRESLLAAFLGGLLVPSLSNYLSAISPSLWQLFMGGLFIAAITVFRGGVAGFLGRAFDRRRRVART
jgi:urea transport system permease protein